MAIISTVVGIAAVIEGLRTRARYLAQMQQMGSEMVTLRAFIAAELADEVRSRTIGSTASHPLN
jgi:Spy/CpxP family protein refolding chaperone